MVDALLPGCCLGLKTGYGKQYLFNYNNVTTIGKKTIFKTTANPPHPLGRHPFNIVTEEIYDND